MENKKPEMIFPKQNLCKARVKNKIFLNEKTVQVDFELMTPPSMPFLPGQFITLKVADAAFRAYSICSDSTKPNVITIVLTVVHDGLGSNYIKNLNVGDLVSFVGPSGRFVLSEEKKGEILFLATGTGFSPVMSMIYKLIEQHYGGRVRLYVGFRNETDIFGMDVIDLAEQNLKDFEYNFCISDPSPKWKGLKGRITEYYKIEYPEQTQVYICGNPYMVSEVTTALMERGVPDENIFHEKFTVSGGAPAPVPPKKSTP